MLISLKVSRNSAFFSGSDKPRAENAIFSAHKCKKLATVGILTFMSRKNNSRKYKDIQKFSFFHAQISL